MIFKAILSNGQQQSVKKFEPHLFTKTRINKWIKEQIHLKTTFNDVHLSILEVKKNVVVGFNRVKIDQDLIWPDEDEDKFFFVGYDEIGKPRFWGI
jgi:hypothetical protein